MQLLRSGFLLLGVFVGGCGAENSGGNNPSELPGENRFESGGEPSGVVDITDTSSFCADGVQVEPMRVSGTSWDNGFGKTSASVLLKADSIDELSLFRTAQLNTESEPRNIKSARTTGNGRQVIIFDGEIIRNSASISIVCLRSNGL